MWRILVAFLLVAVAAGQNSGFPSALSLADGYLPPAGPDNITPNSVRCDPAKTIYRTQTRKVTKTVTKVVVEKVPQVIEKTSVVKQVVPKTIFVTNVKQVKSPVVRTQVRTVTLDRVISKTINVPGQIRVVTETKVQNQISYKTIQRVVEVIKVTTSTQVRYVPDVQRVIQTVTKRVPQVVYVTKTVLVPGRKVVATKIEQKQVTSVKQYQPPAQSRVQNEVKYVTSVVIRQVPGPVINKVNNVVRTTVVERISVKKVPQIKTEIVQKYEEVVRTVTKTKAVSRIEVKYITKTRNVPVVVTKTEERIIPVPLQLTKTVTVVKPVPGPDVVRTVYRNEVQVKTVRGEDRVINQVRNVDRVETKVVEKIIIKPSVVEKVITRTQPCQGYRYDAPSNPLKF